MFVRKIMDDVKNSNKQANYITFSAKGQNVYFSKTKSKVNTSFSCEDMVDAINIIIDNAFVLYYDKIFRQVIGIPMGTNCAPFLANIFLHVYEYEYLQHLIDNGEIDVAQKLSRVYRYQDDCIALNDDGVFSKHYSKMYPPEMVLECTNVSKKVVTFLDLRISVVHGKFWYRSYDKRNNFNFNICNFPNLKGNVPMASSYGVYTSQLVRLCDINQKYNNFLTDVRKMTEKFSKQGFDLTKLKTLYTNFCIKFLYKWSKYGVNITMHGNKIFHNSSC